MLWLSLRRLIQMCCSFPDTIWFRFGPCRCLSFSLCSLWFENLFWFWIEMAVRYSSIIYLYIDGYCGSMWKFLCSSWSHHIHIYLCVCVYFCKWIWMRGLLLTIGLSFLFPTKVKSWIFTLFNLTLPHIQFGHSQWWIATQWQNTHLTEDNSDW